jgi:hypothetical protein
MTSTHESPAVGRSRTGSASGVAGGVGGPGPCRHAGRGAPRRPVSDVFKRGNAVLRRGAGGGHGVRRRPGGSGRSVGRSDGRPGGKRRPAARGGDRAAIPPALPFARACRLSRRASPWQDGTTPGGGSSPRPRTRSLTTATESGFSIASCHRARRRGNYWKCTRLGKMRNWHRAMGVDARSPRGRPALPAGQAVAISEIVAGRDRGGGGHRVRRRPERSPRGPDRPNGRRLPGLGVRSQSPGSSGASRRPAAGRSGLGGTV